MRRWGSNPLARFLAQRATKSYDMAGPGGLFRVRSVASAPGDPFARFVLRTASKERLVETAAFYCDVLRMSEVGMPSDEEKCFRYKPVPGGALVGVPTTLVFQVAAGAAMDGSSSSDGGDDEAKGDGMEEAAAVECFDHLGSAAATSAPRSITSARKTARRCSWSPAKCSAPRSWASRTPTGQDIPSIGLFRGRGGRYLAESPASAAPLENPRHSATPVLSASTPTAAPPLYAIPYNGPVPPHPHRHPVLHSSTTARIVTRPSLLPVRSESVGSPATALL